MSLVGVGCRYQLKFFPSSESEEGVVMLLFRRSCAVLTNPVLPDVEECDRIDQYICTNQYILYYLIALLHGVRCIPRTHDVETTYL